MGAIKIGAKYQAIDADAPNEVIDLAQHDLERSILDSISILAHVIHGEIEPNQSPGFLDRVQLLIGQVACRGADGMSIGVRCDQGSLG